MCTVCLTVLFFMTIECSQSVHSIVEEFGCIVAILVMLGLFIFLNQSYIQKFIYEERLNQMDLMRQCNFIKPGDYKEMYREICLTDRQEI